MSKRGPSPFAALDTSLLRETQGDGKEAPGADGRRGRGTASAAAEPATDPVAATVRALKTVGKEIYYVRVTPDEKQRVADAIHAFGQRGIRTSVNEIGRIALNTLLEDYETNGASSLLARVLEGKRA